MSFLYKKRITLLVLTDAKSLVNSNILLERERERERETQAFIIYNTRARNIGLNICLANKTTNSLYFISREILQTKRHCCRSFAGFFVYTTLPKVQFY